MTEANTPALTELADIKAPEIPPEALEAFQKVAEALKELAKAIAEALRHLQRTGPEKMVAHIQAHEETKDPEEIREADPREGPRHHGRGRDMKKREGSRYEICVICGLEWNVSKELRIYSPGYICPHCTGKERSDYRERKDHTTGQDLRKKAGGNH